MDEKNQETKKNLTKPDKTRKKPDKKCKNPKCKHKAIKGTNFCYICNPENRKKAKEIGKLGGRPKKIKVLEVKKLKEMTPRKIDDVLIKIGKLQLYVEASEISEWQAKIILRSCEVALQALEQQTIEQKINGNNIKAVM